MLCQVILINIFRMYMTDCDNFMVHKYGIVHESRLHLFTALFATSSDHSKNHNKKTMGDPTLKFSPVV